VAELAKDPSPEVRLQVAAAVPRIEGLDRLDVLLTVLDQPTDDPLLPRVAWRQLQPAIARQGADFVTRWQRAQKIPTPLQAELAPRALDVLLAQLKPREGGQAVSPAVIGKFVAAFRDSAPAVFQDCLRRLAGRVETGELPQPAIASLKSELEPTLAPLLANASAHPAGLDAALLVTAWGDPRGVKVARQNFATRGLNPELRLRALQSLVASRDEGLLDAVAASLTEPAVVGPKADQATQALVREFPGKVLAALGRLDDPRVAEVVLQAWDKLPPDVQPRAVELLTGRVAWARRLLNAMGDKQVSAALMNQTQARTLLALRDAELTELVARHWGRIREGRNPQRDAVIAEFRAEFHKNPGDPLRGKAAYAKVCGQCHKLFGEGAEVGPELTDNGRSTYDQLLSNVFDPSLVIGAAYQARTVLTTGGRAVTGLVVEDSPEHIILKVQGGKLETIPRSEIDEEKQSEQSLMPEDVEKALTRQELLDLFAYITLDRPPTDPEARSIRGMRDTTPRDATEPALFGSILVETAPGFVTQKVGERGLGFLRSHGNRERVLRTHPVDKDTPCELIRTVQVPSEGKPRLKLEVAHDRAGDWRLVILGNGEKLHDQIIGPETAQGGWVDLEIDLQQFAGQSVTLVLQNAANNWSNEFGYWRNVEFVVD
jgi:putative heme-binding domain-containing protein